MKISIEHHASAPAECRYSAIDEDDYDGAPDTPWYGKFMGWGHTPFQAIADLREQRADWEEEQRLKDEGIVPSPEEEWLDDMQFNRMHSWGRS